MTIYFMIVHQYYQIIHLSISSISSASSGMVFMHDMYLMKLMLFYETDGTDSSTIDDNYVDISDIHD